MAPAPAHHSQRSVSTGLSRAATRPGRYPATSASPASNPHAAANAGGSVGFTPNNIFSNKRVTTIAPAIPAATPMPTGTAVSARTIRVISTGRAPNANRMPISLCRRATWNAMTP